MSVPSIVEHAQAAPGVCFISGDNEGPFIDTGRTVRRVGRIYLSLKHLGPLLRSHGWLTTEDTEELRHEIDRLKGTIQGLSVTAEKHANLVEAISPFAPQPEAVEVERVVERFREPTQADIADYVARNPHVLRSLKTKEPGSVEEWNELYRPDKHKTDTTAAVADVEQEETPPISSDSVGDAPASVIEIHGQEVNLDEVLDNNVNDIADFLDGIPVEAQRALLEREVWRAEARGDKPRKTIIRLVDQEVVA